jgi:FkbM family methyltransferase
MKKFIRNVLSIIPRNFIFCDVGARWGIEEPWKSFDDTINICAFEPDKDEFDSLMIKKGDKEEIYPYALYKESKDIPLNLTKSRGCSSLYTPNYDFLKNFNDVERFEVEDQLIVKATTLDNLFNNKVLTNMDFIKIDTQGAELDILEGGEKFLSENIIGIQVEVEFQPLYKDQPLFSDIDVFIRKRLGLQLQDLRKTYWKYPEGVKTGATKGQLVFGDALYFRSPQEIFSWCSCQKKNEAAIKLHMAILMGVVYGYLDFSLCLLSNSLLNEYFEKKIIERWRSIILDYGKSLRIKIRGAGRLANIFTLLYRMCQPTHEGWASVGHHLGMKKKYGIFY